MSLFQPLPAPSSLLLPILFTCALAPSISAQSQLTMLPAVDDTGVTTDLVNQGETSGTFSRAGSGDLVGDGLNDLAYLRGGSVFVKPSPGLCDGVLPEVVTANDFAVLRAGSGAATLAVVNADGLLEVSFAGAQPEVSWTRTSLESTNWAGARLVETGDPSGGLRPAIWGVMADGVSLRRMRDDGSGYVDAALFSASGQVLDFLTFELDGTAPKEIAIMYADGLEVWQYVATNSQSGAEIWNELYEVYPAGLSSSAIAVGSQAGETTEWVALVTQVIAQPALQFLSIYSDASLSAPTLLLDAPFVSAMQSGDWNGDGNSDLVMNWRRRHRLTILENQGVSEPSFDSSTSGSPPTALHFDMGPGGQNVNSLAEPHLFDLDQDGDLDLACAVESSGNIFVRLGEGENSMDFSPQTEQQASGVSKVALGWHDFGFPWAQPNLHLMIQRPTRVPPQPTLPEELKIQIAIFRMDWNGTDWELDPVSRDEETFPLPESGTSYRGTLEVDDNEHFEQMYFWIQRMVVVDNSTNEIVRVYPQEVYGLQAQWFDPSQGVMLTDTGNHLWLMSEVAVDPLSYFEAVGYHEDWDTSDGSGASIGTGTLALRLPKLPANTTPVILPQ